MDPDPEFFEAAAGVLLRALRERGQDGVHHVDEVHLALRGGELVRVEGGEVVDRQKTSEYYEQSEGYVSNWGGGEGKDD